MLKALGARFLDEENNEIGLGGGELHKLHHMIYLG